MYSLVMFSRYLKAPPSLELWGKVQWKLCSFGIKINGDVWVYGVMVKSNDCSDGGPLFDREFTC